MDTHETEEKATILIVEDDIETARMIEVLLERRGYSILVVHSGKEALTALGLGEPGYPNIPPIALDLILLDVMMQGIDGYHVCKQLRADPRAVYIPIVMVTALDSLTDMVRGLECGADDYIVKPFKSGEFLARIRSMLRIKRLYDERKQAEKELTTHKRDLQRLSAQIINAQEVERQRISQELHDEIGQALTGMSINLAEIGKKLPSEIDPATRERLVETRSLVDRVLEQIREMALDLRPAMLDDLGLAPTLRWYVNRYAKRLNVEVELEMIDLKERLAAEMETALYRAVQEGLTNIARHAQADRVRIHLERKASSIFVFIEDDGKGFDAPKSVGRGDPEHGVGLLGIRERVTSLGGSFGVQSRPGRGTRLTIKIPLRWGEGV